MFLYVTYLLEIFYGFAVENRLAPLKKPKNL
jgi:hypothetical protein